MGKQQFHSINRGEDTILYDIENIDLFCGNNISKEQLRALNNRQDASQSSESDYIGKCKVVNNHSVNGMIGMHRITVCVSNDCNLRCKYCYAKGGSYGKARSLMSKETAKDFVDFCCRNFSGIDSILFFGGEPLVNYEIIAYICELFKEQAKNRMSCLPSFALITNGTLCNSDIMDLLRNHISHVTVSIDGNRYVNDANRVFSNGAGSYDKIAHFIEACKGDTHVRLKFEATYTAEHIKAGISRADVYTYLHTTFGMKGIVVDEDSLSREVIYDDLCNITTADMLATDFECLPNDFWQATSVMVKKEPHKFCGIFDDRITVTVDGDIVGCQMLIGNDNNIVGNIHDADAVEKIRSRMRNYKDNAACSECWCRHLCGGCAVLRFYSKEEGKMTADPDRELCSFTKMYLEEILYKLYQIRSDAVLWPLFLKKAASKLKYL